MKIRFDRTLISISTALLTWGVMEAATAAPYQLPLLGMSPVAPNVVFTLDDSGSMLGPLMPDDLTSDKADGNCCNVQTLAVEEVVNTYAYDNTYKAYGLIPTRMPNRPSAEYLDDAKRRSSQSNSIYYNPETRYEPWTNSDGTLKAVPTASSTTNWTAVLQSPMVATTSNLTPRALGSSVQWCLTIGTCDSRGNVNLGTAEANAQADYDPTVYYILDNATTPTQAGTKRISIWNMKQYTRAANGSTTATSLSSLTRGANRTDCTAVSTTVYSCSQAQELQNFATWYMYHRTRLMLAKASVSKAFASPDITGFRLGWGALNNLEGSSSISLDGVNSTTLRQGVRNFTTSHKDAFYSWLFNKSAASGTPLRRAVDDIGTYYSREDNKGPWADEPGTSNTQSVASYAACRRAFHILTTDGYWSVASSNAPDMDANTAGAKLDVESRDGPQITGPNSQSYQYLASSPANARYKDGAADMLADVGMYYWNRDIAPNMLNKITPTANNPAFWQHMVNYTVGLGTKGNLVNPTDQPALENGTKRWQPTGTTSSNITDAGKADDLWHAAYNSRGLNLSAANSTEFAAALQAALTDIANESNKTAGVSLNGPTLGTDSAKYVPRYTSRDWTGDVSKYAINVSTAVASDTPSWNAASHIPAAASRNIYVWKDALNKAIPFNLGNLGTGTGSLLADMGATPVVNDALINYLRGDASNEGTAPGNYRKRSSRLGDIVNAPPVYVGHGLDFKYESLQTAAASQSYRDFVDGLASREPLIFAGANDGMLHAFADSDGAEIFAYIPRAVLPNLSYLSNQSYGHRYFVDGPLIETHAYMGGWKSILVGTLGSGGKGLYAIDVTSPSELRNLSTAGRQVLWELNSTANSSVGYILSEPEIGPMKIGTSYTWVALVNNGLESASNKAQLLVVDLASGSVLATLDTNVGTPAAPNGLSAVRAVRNFEGLIIAAYAGDLQGNVWRFNLSGTASSQWGVAFGGTPLFKATDSNGVAQPITAAPVVLPHPRGGSMVVVGSGKLAYEADRPGVSAAGSQVQTIYGLWDTVRPSLNPSSASTTIASKTALLQQIINTTAVATNSAGRSFYDETGNLKPNWDTQKGWYVNLTLGTGQRVIYPPQFVSNGYVLIGTVIPTTSTACSSATAFNGLLDALSGGVNGKILLDTNGDGVVNQSDISSSFYSTENDGRDAISARERQTLTPDDPTQFCKRGRLVYASGNSVPQCIGAGSLSGSRTWRLLNNPPGSE